MKAAFFAWPTILLALAAAAPAFAQLGDGKPVYPRIAAPAVRFLTQGEKPAEKSSFESYREFYADVAKKRGLADPDGDFAVQQIESRVSVEHLRDYSGDSIAVVKLDAARASDNASFFVIREKEGRVRVLGEMKGRAYESSTARGHLE